MANREEILSQAFPGIEDEPILDIIFDVDEIEENRQIAAGLASTASTYHTGPTVSPAYTFPRQERDDMPRFHPELAIIPTIGRLAMSLKRLFHIIT